MNSKQHWLALAFVVAMGAALGTACGDGEKEKENRCASVQCLDPATTCDPADGVCKCGTGEDKIICKSTEICQTEPAPSCLQDRCVGVTCDNGETCDPSDGVCKCGPFTCQDGEVCSQNRCVVPDPCQGLLCPEGQACDPADGACKCGGEICADDQRCDDGLCVKDPCKGVHCGGSSVCNPEDLSCHCGTVTGPVCMTGQSCNEDEFGSHVCDVVDQCVGVSCDGDAVCDPDFGVCRCGGLGPEFPVCKEGQICHMGQCVGGNLCLDVECLPGFDCNPETGQCECGGRLCAQDETCMTITVEGVQQTQCVRQCDPFATTSVCEAGESCYVDLNIGATVGYCAPTGDKGFDEECEIPQNCAPGYTCLGGVGATCQLVCWPGTSFGHAYCGEDFRGCMAGEDDKYGFCLKL